MKKEVLLAIIIGFGIGLLITFGIYTARTALENNPKPSPPPQNPTNSQEPTATLSAQLTITSPLNDTLIDNDTIQLKGKATPEAIITVITSKNQQIVSADDQGDFTTAVKLAGGANQIDITAFTAEGSKTETKLNIVYSTAKIE